MQKPITYLLALVLIHHCQSFVTSTTSVPVVQLGANFYTQTNFPMGGSPCLAFTSDNYVMANPEATFDFSEAENFSDLESSLGIDVSSHIGWGMFSADARADYAKSQYNSNYDLNFNYIFKYTAQAVLTLDSTKNGTAYLSAVGLQHYNNGPEDFLQNCGDSFVQQADAGATLVVTYNLQFTNQLDKESFQAELDLSYGIGSISTKIQQAEASTKTSLTVNLKAIQIGGHPERLQDILGLPDQGGYALLECGQTDASGNVNLTACVTAINKIIDYAHSQGAYVGQGLESQIAIDSTGHPVDPSAFFYDNPVAVTWAQINANPGPIQPSPLMIQDQADLTNWYLADSSDLVFLNHYIPFLQSLQASPLVIDALKSNQNNLTERIAAYSELNVLECFMGGYDSDCIQKHDTLEILRNLTYTVDEDTLNFYQNAYWNGNFSSPANSTTWIYPVGPDLYMQTIPTFWRGNFYVNSNGDLVTYSWDTTITCSGTLTPYQQYGYTCYQGIRTQSTGYSYRVNFCLLPNPM